MRLNEYLFKDAIWRLKKSPHPNLLHRWQSDSELETGRWEVPGSIPGHTCRPSHSEFFVVFLETRVNMGQVPQKDSVGWHCLTGPGPTSGQLGLILQPNKTHIQPEYCCSHLICTNKQTTCEKNVKYQGINLMK